MMKCAVYKSLRKQDTYLYVEKSACLDELPQDLRQLLGKTSWVMDLELTPETRLARRNAEEVLATIARQGFYLQLPPAKASL